MRRLSKKKVSIVISVSIIVMIVGIYLYPCFVSHDYFNEFPASWKVISTGHYSDDIFDCYQVALSGDFLGTSDIVTVAGYHHGHPGIFVNYKDGDSWSRYPIHSQFDPDNVGAWPTKGFISADVDADGYPEIITAMDAVYYPANHIGTTRRAFPGIIYLDSNSPNPEPQPLVWGAWGENITSTGISNCIPVPADPKFRSPSNDKMDIIVPTMTKVAGGNGARVFLLEQPGNGFSSVNYTYVTENITGSIPYLSDPFYVKRFYVQTGQGIEEMVWRPDEVTGATGVYSPGVVPIHLDSDNNMDLVVGGAYTDGETIIRARITLYRRVLNLSIDFLFEEIQTFWIDDASVMDAKAANLDGDPTNGKESVVFGFNSNNSASYPYSGVISLIPNGTGYELSGISNPNGTHYPYIRVYSRLVVMDCDKDGYDDAMIFCKEYATWETSYGDLVLFLNQKGGLSSSDVFSYTDGQYEILFDNQCITWGLFAQQLDNDADLGITVCNTVLLPHWCPLTSGVKYAYGLDVVDYLKSL
ncbi:MAG: hypothetical protein ACTSYL_04280 [Candidatus Thorarchaeota archaeon]